MMNELLEVQQMLRSRGILICFSGKLTQTLIVEYGEAVKTYLEAEDRPKNEIFNIFSLFIEQTQNIKNYYAMKMASPHYETLLQSSIVTIGKTESGSYVCSGNLIENEDAAALKAALDELVRLDKTELKALYKAKLRAEPDPGATGAGLGMIDMARKASAPLEYSIVGHNERLSFFTLKAIV
ncbi:SiaB family protein kinase [Paenibacillus sp.]|uniref:SiaB family protein kinase n=1 Tax=Paenibacillus sp. TaxID=58172 RepID=UPI002D4AAFBD|nr:SiaB family protein kinase [Paenibacillus sp.]HZG84349.1 SiaB family protein kinase [Paenibacillus sp.]